MAVGTFGLSSVNGQAFQGKDIPEVLRAIIDWIEKNQGMSIIAMTIERVGDDNYNRNY